MIDAEGRTGRFITTEGSQWNHGPARRFHLHILECFGTLPVLRRCFHDDMVLIERVIDSGDLALPKGVIQCGIDHSGSDA